jgi:hypothetical protein
MLDMIIRMPASLAFANYAIVLSMLSLGYVRCTSPYYCRSKLKILHTVNSQRRIGAERLSIVACSGSDL